MTKSEVLHRIHHTGLLPVLRASSVPQALAIAEAILAGGCPILEITLTVPGAIEVIRTLVARHPEALIGAGTVLDPESARTCIQQGAQFIVSPATNLATIELCRRSSIAVFPGALTPTEIVAAWQAGADVIKVFPASAVGGARYLRSINAALPEIKLIPTGGISLASAREFLEAGAFALGVGADLANPQAILSGAPEAITETARAYTRIVASVRTPAS